ncbi:MAG TPA: MerR family transcriptional regulator [Candidatus Limnocylindria bacterium]
MKYRIGEAARRVGVSPSALRLWERQGLVKPQRAGSAYRIYTDGDLEQLRSIRRLRQVDRLNAPGIRRVLRDTRPPDADGRRDGQPLRRVRKERGLSMREASERSGLSISFISALERGVSGASVATLQRLTAAYGTTLHDLFGSPEEGTPNRLVRAGEGRALRLGSADVRIEELSRATRQLEPQLFILAPGASSDGAYAHDGEEFLYLLSGAVTVWVGDEECYTLDREGDALSFPSTLPHRWRNDAGRESRLLWINTPPTF